MLKEQYDENKANEIIEGLNSKKYLTLRINRLKTDRDYILNYFKEKNINFEEIPWFHDAFIINELIENDIRKLDIYEDGKIYMQSLSSMIPPIVLNPENQENILDMCAAPRWKNDSNYFYFK